LTSVVFLFIDLVRVEKKEIENKKQFQDLNRKYLNTDRDIKTLHTNQKVLQSLIKEIRKDLILYGEIKKSRTKAIAFEKTEKEGNL
jgi:septal ring factor EnvC (AmiA/AmiB activator)